MQVHVKIDDEKETLNSACNLYHRKYNYTISPPATAYKNMVSPTFSGTELPGNQ